MGANPMGAIAILAWAISGCCGSDVGCVGGLFIDFQSPPTGYVRVQVVKPASDPPRFFECDSYPTQCSGSGTAFRDFTPRMVTFRISTETGSRDVTVQPRYTTTAPNGLFCDPKCRGATIRLELP